MDGNWMYPDEMLGDPVKMTFDDLPYKTKIEKTLHFRDVS